VFVYKNWIKMMSLVSEITKLCFNYRNSRRVSIILFCKFLDLVL